MRTYLQNNPVMLRIGDYISICLIKEGNSYRPLIIINIYSTRCRSPPALLRTSFFWSIIIHVQAIYSYLDYSTGGRAIIQSQACSLPSHV